MATCIKCGIDMGGNPGTSICQDCVTILLKNKSPEELVALAKIGLDAVIDEVTGYQNIRPKGELKERHQRYFKGKCINLCSPLCPICNSRDSY